MPEAGTGRQGSLCRHIRHIRHQFWLTRFHGLAGRLACAVAIVSTCLPSNFLTQTCLDSQESALVRDQLVRALPESHSAEREAALSSIGRSPAPAPAPSILPWWLGRLAGYQATAPPDAVSLFAVTNYSSLALYRSFLGHHQPVHVRPPPSDIASPLMRGALDTTRPALCLPVPSSVSSDCCNPAPRYCRSTLSAGAHPTPRLVQAIPLRYVSSRPSAAVLR